MQSRPPSPPVAVLVDSGELWPHPWRFHAPAGVTLVRGRLEAGGLAIAGAEDAAAVRRLTVGDLLNRIGRGRDAFESELRRGRHVGHFVVVVEGSFEDLVAQSPRARPASVIGTLAAWTRRYCPFQFCETPDLAAAFSFRFLLQPIREAAELTANVERAATGLAGNFRQPAADEAAPAERCTG